jgi:hypothetical protein
MFLRITRVARKGRTYQYGDVVESYREAAGGLPRHRVLMKLGPLTSEQAASWRTALNALAQGQRLVVAPPASPTAAPVAPESNLRYLDVAVVLEVFREWGLEALCDELLGPSQAEVTAGQMLAALVVQRCVEPGSKLFASRWFPRSALPELLGVPPGALNNTRIHRVLNDLSQVDEALQQSVSRRYQQRDGRFVALFLDTTEATFEGRGPKLAEKGHTKDGIFKRRIAVPLLCNERGYPLRWDVLRGKVADCNVFVDTCHDLAEVSWAQGVPLVMDRAAGTTETFSRLLETGLHVVTALVAQEKPAYAPNLPTEAFGAIPLHELDQACELAAQAALEAGLSRLDDDLYMLDLGQVERQATGSEPRSAPKDPATPPTEHGRQRLELAHALADDVARGLYPSLAKASAARGIGQSAAKKYRQLLRLAPVVQEAVLQGRTPCLPLARLLALTKLPANEQEAALAQGLQAVPPTTQATPAGEPGLRVRAVAYFNPSLFVEKRTNRLKAVATVRQRLTQLNQRLARPQSRSSRDQVAAAADRLLRKFRLLDVMTIKIRSTQADDDRTQYQVEFELDEQAWERRRRYDGFTVLVAHPDIQTGAAQLCRLYRQRELIEHDFRIIHSLIEMDPVRHRLDHKVKAHVAICMLALLVERTLRHKLGDRVTAEQALEILGSCHLNHFGGKSYALTKPTPQQERLLRKLKLSTLTDHSEVLGRITPRDRR